MRTRPALAAVTLLRPDITRQCGACCCGGRLWVVWLIDVLGWMGMLMWACAATLRALGDPVVVPFAPYAPGAERRACDACLGSREGLLQLAAAVANAEDQQPSCHRIERAGVPDLAGTEEATQLRHDIMAGHASWLIDDDHARGG